MTRREFQARNKDADRGNPEFRTAEINDQHLVHSALRQPVDQPSQVILDGSAAKVRSGIERLDLALIRLGRRRRDR